VNRVSHRIAKVTAQVAERELSKERLAEFQKSLDMSFEERLHHRLGQLHGLEPSGPEEQLQ
jgi:hypothetical protein